MAESSNGEDPTSVFQERLPKVSPIMGKEPTFTRITNSLFGRKLITRPELTNIKSKQTLTDDQRGSELAYLIYDKIEEKSKESREDAVQYLIKVCDILISKDVDNDSLKKYGDEMSKLFSDEQKPKPSPTAPTSSTATKKAKDNKELDMADLKLIKEVLKEAMFGSVKWMDFGLSLGLFMPTLNVIDSTKGDANSYLQKTLEKWLEKEDKVTGTTWNDLIRAVRSTGDNAAADRIPAILKARNIKY